MKIGSALVCLAFGFGVAHAAAETSVVKIGVVQTTSGGPAAIYGVVQKNGAELAIAEINASRVLGDTQIVAIYEDDAGDRGQTVNVYQRLLFQEKVSGIFGPSLSNSAFAADPIAQKAGVPVIASSNTAPGITEMGDFIFRTSPPESSVFPGVLAYATRHFPIKKVAQIYGVDDMLMKSAYAVHKKALEAAGLQIEATETFQKGDVDYSAQLTKIKSVKPDAIVVSGLAEETANIVRQARELGIPQTVPIIGANAAISAKLAELAGRAAEGFIVGAGWFIDDPTPRNQAFVAAYRTKYASDPNVFSAQAYTAIYVFADAVRRVGGSPDPKLIRDAIAKTSKLETNTGAFGFDASREPIVEPKVLVLREGKFALADKN